MSDRGPDNVKTTIQGMLDKFLDDDNPLKPVETTIPKIIERGRCALRADQELTAGIAPIQGRSMSGVTGLSAVVRALTAPLSRPHKTRRNLRVLMSGEPTKPKSPGEVSAGQRAESGKAGRLPEATPSLRKTLLLSSPRPRDVAHAAGAKAGWSCARRHHEPAADMGFGLRAASRHVFARLRPSAASISLVYYRGLNECRATGGFPTARNWQD